jgi:hypothetical protein
LGSLRFIAANRFNRFSRCNHGTSGGNRFGNGGIPQNVASYPLLTRELLVNQFPRNLQGSPGLMGKGLGASQSSVRWADRPGRRENRAIPFQHDESRVLIGKPAECCERDESVTSDYDQTAETMPYAGKPGLEAVCPKSVLDDQMPPVNMHTDPISEQSQNAMPESKRIAGL